MQPRGVKGGSASKISLIEPMPASATTVSKPARRPRAVSRLSGCTLSAGWLNGRTSQVRPERRVIAVFAIDDIVKAPAALVPEAAVEGLPRQFGVTRDLVGFRMARVAQPLRQQRQRVVP